MKKLPIILLVGVLLVTLVSCGKGNADQSAVNANEEQSSADIGSQANGSAESKNEWPEEFSKWDVPTIDSAIITFADNKSVTSTGFTQGLTASVILEKLSKSDFDKYIETLTNKGFVKNKDESLEGVMLIYDRVVTGGIIKMTISYTENSTTIIVNNSAAAAEKEASAGGSVDWPESIKGIPEFTKGSYIETVEMGGGMYAINYKDVTEEDVEWYRSALKSAGFEKQDSDDTEGYAKFSADKAYSVGFLLEDGKLQIIALSSSY